jgi:hypothetical protein
MEQNTINIIIIIILSALLFISILGIDILRDFVNIIIYAFLSVAEFIGGFLKVASYSTGEVVNGTGDVVAGTSIFGIELIDGVIHDVGNMFKGQATPVATGTNHLDIIIQRGGGQQTEPAPVETGHGPEKWCFVGVSNGGENKCVKLHDTQKCSNGQLFNTAIDCRTHGK